MFRLNEEEQSERSLAAARLDKFMRFLRPTLISEDDQHVFASATPKLIHRIFYEKLGHLLEFGAAVQPNEELLNYGRIFMLSKNTGVLFLLNFDKMKITLDTAPLKKSPSFNASDPRRPKETPQLPPAYDIYKVLPVNSPALSGLQEYFFNEDEDINALKARSPEVSVGQFDKMDIDFLTAFRLYTQGLLPAEFMDENNPSSELVFEDKKVYLVVDNLHDSEITYHFDDPDVAAERLNWESDLDLYFDWDASKWEMIFRYEIDRENQDAIRRWLVGKPIPQETLEDEGYDGETFTEEDAHALTDDVMTKLFYAADAENIEEYEEINEALKDSYRYAEQSGYEHDLREYYISEVKSRFGDYEERGGRFYFPMIHFDEILSAAMDSSSDAEDDDFNEESWDGFQRWFDYGFTEAYKDYEGGGSLSGPDSRWYADLDKEYFNDLLKAELKHV